MNKRYFHKKTRREDTLSCYMNVIPNLDLVERNKSLCTD